MIDPGCAVTVGSHHGPYWRNALGGPDWQVCDRHRRMYDERDDLGPFEWVRADRGEPTS